MAVVITMRALGRFSRPCQHLFHLYMSIQGWNAMIIFGFSAATSSPALVISASSASIAIGLETEDLKQNVKARLPGGFASQTNIGTGRRKSAIARVVLQEGTCKVIINYHAKEFLQGNPLWVQYVKVPLVTLGYESSYDVFVKAHGGGLSGQAQAIYLGVGRAWLKISADHRSPQNAKFIFSNFIER